MVIRIRTKISLVADKDTAALSFFDDWVDSMRKGKMLGDEKIGIEHLYGKRPTSESEKAVLAWIKKNLGLTYFKFFNATPSESFYRSFYAADIVTDEIPVKLFVTLKEKLKDLDPNAELRMKSLATLIA